MGLKGRCGMLLLMLLPGILASAPEDEVEGEASRKILGSSVVTSVSVIMDTGNGSKAVFSDAAGRPVAKPSAAAHLASPINLLNPDRYEFYTFDDSGDLVKRLMTLQEIQQIIASGDGDGMNYGDRYQSLAMEESSPDKKVDDVVSNVQNVLKEEMERSSDKPLVEVPELPASWTMMLPGAFGGVDDIVPEGPLIVATPETIMIEPTEAPMSTESKENVNVMSSQESSSPASSSSSATVATTLNTAAPSKASSPTTLPFEDQKETTINSQIITNNLFQQEPEAVAQASTLSSSITASTGNTIFPAEKQSTPSSITSTFSNVPTQKPLELATNPVTETTTTKMAPPTPTAESTKAPIAAEDFPSSTYSFLSTFFNINDLQNNSAVNTNLPEETTTNTEKVVTSTAATVEAKPLQNTEPSTIGSIEKLAVTELLDQLLLSSTNIYQLNSELTKPTENNLIDAESKTDASPAVVTEQTTAPQVETTDNIISSIEQLLAQAMAGFEEPENTTQGEKVHEFMVNMGQKNMSDVQEQTATIMSSLMGNLDVDLIKQQNEESVLNNVSSTTIEPPLDEAVETFISQMVFEEVGNATTIVDDLPIAASTTEISDGEIRSTTEEKGEIYAEAASSTTNEGFSTTEEELKTEESFSSIDEKVEQTTENYYPSSTETPTVYTDSEDKLSTIEAQATTTELQQPTTIVDTTPNDATSSSQTIKAEEEVSQTPQELMWAPVSTIAPSTTAPTEKLPSIATTTPFSLPVDLSSQISAGFGLEDTTVQLDTDIYQFVQLCNELAFSFWKSAVGSLSPSRSLVVSPFAATSLLAMVFLGARGATSGEMNEILKLDDMVTFNPHLIFRNVSESIEVSKKAGVAASAIVRELYSDKTKGKLLRFYKERVRHFYDGHVEEANFKEIGDVIRRRTNLLVKRYTWGKIHEFLKENSVSVRPPLAGVSVNVFQTDCSSASTNGRDGEIYFQVSPTIRQRRLVPIPAVVWRSGFLAGYEPSLDATAVAIGTKEQLISTIFVMPGQQGIAAPGDGLARLELHLVDSAFKDGAWVRLLKSLIPRTGLEVQVPRFAHKSFVNATTALQRMGLKDLFDARKADLRGLNGVSHELYLSDIIQINNFATCGEGRIDETHHVETYPNVNNGRAVKKLRTTEEIDADFVDPRDYQRAFDDPLFDPDYLTLPLPLRPRQARLPDTPKLRFDRPFLYFVRHNPTGLILHMGRFNPRLLP